MLPLKLVLDTNIIISAALHPDGLQRTVLLLAMTRPARWYISVPILSEYRIALSRPEFNICERLRQPFLQLIEDRSRLVSPWRQFRVTSDPDGDIFLKCADAARADYLVTGDLPHFPHLSKRTKIITSRDFVMLIAPHLASWEAYSSFVGG